MACKLLPMSIFALGIVVTPVMAAPPADRCASPAPAADLSTCDFSRRSLAGLDLTGARLEGAKLENANLRGARLDGAQDIPASVTEAVASRYGFKPE